MWGFDEEDVEETAHDAFFEYDPDMETVDWGDAETSNFEISQVSATGNELRLQEQTIDISEIPPEDISPELEKGDRVFVWDIDYDYSTGEELRKITISIYWNSC